MRALFLDRDGVINRRLVGEYVRTPNEFELLEDILPILAEAKQKGYVLILISNQQGVGKGLMTESDLEEVNGHMQRMIEDRLNFCLDDIRVCTSLASENDPRRKPQPGMLLEAIQEHSIDPSGSWFIGDSATDAQAGRAAGVRTALVGDHSTSLADVVAPDLFSLQRALTPKL